MKTNFLLTTGLMILLTLSLQARHHGGGKHNANQVESNLTQEVKDSIVYVATQERMMNNLYTNINSEVNSSTLVSAIRATNKDRKKINRLAKKYDLNLSVYPEATTSYSADEVASFTSGSYIIEDVQTNYNILSEQGIASEQAALEVGCMATVTNINDINSSLTLAEDINATDVMHSFEKIINHNYRNYQLFDEALEALDVTDGCCSLEEEYCHTEYPQFTQTTETNTSTSRPHRGGNKQGRSSRR